MNNETKEKSELKKLYELNNEKIESLSDIMVNQLNVPQELVEWLIEAVSEKVKIEEKMK